MCVVCVLCFVLLVVGLVLLVGCDMVGYYYQLVSGYFLLMVQCELIDQVIDNVWQVYNDKFVKCLEDVCSICIYVLCELGLFDNGSYCVYVNFKWLFVVWNVFVVLELLVKFKEWCFFVVGCVMYCGYYDCNVVMVYVDILCVQGFDVDVVGIFVYFILGYFDDLLFNIFVGLFEGELVWLIFYELVYQVVYVKGDMVFNELFVIMVEIIGVECWLVDVVILEICVEYVMYDVWCV